ncbi:TonB-dependent receptor [Sphingomonas sp. LHG3406-1]|uniref:TonB-dependent receptor n=1 Tax=Sphingomonas sp. LHG3406-1 TaxID=2804617 RepID=UPI0026167FC2|nr:TonB-dependent receptor [Sphingomonas sp. LHG3406-1]
MKKLFLLCTSAAIFAPTTAFAQSTGSVDFEEEAIIVTGTRTQEVGGVQTPDTSKPKVALTQEAISRSNPGQTILDTINLVPGVSFQNNDAYGSSGGTLNIRGFDSSRISLTFDGIPLNDSGNYAIYSNQQLDPELIEQVNVNLGTTDVDSPTASAVGGTVNYRTRLPSRTFSAQGVASVGEYSFRRFFGVVDTGEIGPFGTRAFISASTAKNDNPFNNYGRVDKQQYNARIYQPIGNNGDFVSISGHYNENRNNFFGSVQLREDAGRVVPNRFPAGSDDRQYNINFPCTTDTPQAGVADTTNSCGTEFDRRYNPSNTGNIRGASRFTLTESLTLTVDPSFQYVKANGGGTATAREFGYDLNPATAGGTEPSRANCSTAANSATVTCAFGYFGGNPFFGRDLNGDGDLLDQVTVVAPSQTRTRRYGVISGLRWDINQAHTLRLSYTYDRANHRQTGEVGFVGVDGEPNDVFPVNDPVAGAGGLVLQKRDRQSYATLNQIAGEYRGEFGQLTVNAGVRAPFFERDLQQNCLTSSASGFVECSSAATLTTAATLNPNWQPAQRRVLKYSKVLPNVGLLYDLTPRLSTFVSYAKGISVPGTDNLYNAFFFPVGTDGAKPRPELTDTFDAGVRYRSRQVQAQLGVWYTRFTDRLASAYDPELNATVYRNLGRVNKWGIDGSVAFSPISQLTLYTFGSWNKSEIQDDLQLGGGSTFDCGSPPTGTTNATLLRNCAFTAGKREAGTPTYTYGASAVGQLGIVQLGVTAKRTGPRYVYDNNLPIFSGDVDVPSGVTQIYGAKAPAYWLVNADARIDMGKFIGPKTYVQLNIYNLFDETYVGGFGGNLSQTVNATSGVYGNPPFVQIGAPRTFSATLSIGF